MEDRATSGAAYLFRLSNDLQIDDLGIWPGKVKNPRWVVVETNWLALVRSFLTKIITPFDPKARIERWKP